jgi:hypothetical protein
MAQRAMTVRSGPWNAAGVRAFLQEAAIPIRLATNGPGPPVVQSLWFVYDGDALCCCTRADAVLTARIARDPRCGFEVSSDLPPYRGVRGSGTATIDADGAATVLPALIERYGQGQTPLAQWLLSRLPDEVSIRISGLTVTSWDYSTRMTPSTGGAGRHG